MSFYPNDPNNTSDPAIKPGLPCGGYIATINNLACQYYSKYYDFKAFGINALVGVKYCFGNESIRKKR